MKRLLTEKDQNHPSIITENMEIPQINGETQQNYWPIISQEFLYTYPYQTLSSSQLSLTPEQPYNNWICFYFPNSTPQ
jgi:hypothetical protein